MERIVSRKLFKLKIRDYERYKGLFSDKVGLEIGGPTNLFRKNGFLPIYPIVKRVDGCNFSSRTIWEGNLKEGINYNYEVGKVGYQYLSDGTTLEMIPSGYYDFVLSSNCLEHIANPLKAINEWVRIIKPGGILLIILPNKKNNFDHKRSITSFEHLVSDFNKNISETDLTHIQEILSLHDLSLDPGAGSFEQFKTRSLKNYENRTLHHHVFDLELLQKIYAFFGIDILLSEDIYSDYVLVGRKGVKTV